MKWRLLAGLAPAIIAYCVPVQADIYAFVDKNGIRHLSNVPNDPRYRMVMRTPAYRKEAAQTSSFAPSSLYAPPFQLGQRNYANPIGQRRLSRVNELNRQRFAADVQRIATQYRLEPALMHAVISAESSYNHLAVSPKGAMGLMQLMPGTAARFGVANAYDPISNMHGGARYLRWLLDYFNDTRLAIAAYNAGEGAVQKYGNQIPPYRETQTYVGRVLGYYQQYKNGVPYNAAPYNASSPLAYNNYSNSYTYYGSGYSPYGSGSLPARSGGVTIITPRKGTSKASTGSATIPRTYLTPTGTRIIVGASGGGANNRRPPMIYSATPNSPSAVSPRSSFFAGNDK